MTETAMQPEVVRARLTALEYLLDDVDRQFPALRTVQARQGSAMWTDIRACDAFADEYTRVLGRLENALTAIRANVQGLLVNLALSARDLTNTDEDIRARMISLAEKLNALPVAVAPPPTTPPPGGTSADPFGGTMSGGPEATSGDSGMAYV